MDADRLRTYLLTLPHVVETMQWGNNLLFWVGDKAIGGKMFTLINLDADRHAVLSFAAGPERYHELLEIEGILPAPYMARIFWVAAERYDIFRPAEWQEHLRHAHELTSNKLPPRTRTILAMPPREQKRIIAERRKALATKPPPRRKPDTPPPGAPS